MDKEIFEDRVKDLLAKNLLLKLFCTLTFLSNIWLGHQNYDLLKNARTIFVPKNLDSRVTITGDHASPEYVKMFARDVTGLTYCYTPGTVRKQFRELYDYFSSDSYPEAKKKFELRADTIERTHLSSSFVISKPIDLDTDKKIMTVTGILRESVDTLPPQSQEKICMITYTILNGTFRIISFEEKVANDGKRDSKAPGKG